MAYKVRRMTFDSYAVFLMEQHLPVISYELLSTFFPCLSISSTYVFPCFPCVPLVFPTFSPCFFHIFSTFFPRVFHVFSKEIQFQRLCAFGAFVPLPMPPCWIDWRWPLGPMPMIGWLVAGVSFPMIHVCVYVYVCMYVYIYICVYHIYRSLQEATHNLFVMFSGMVLRFKWR